MVNYRTYRPEDFEAVRDLFVKGLMGFAGEYRAEYCRYVKHSLDDDLSDISGQYLDSASNHFWVAEAEDRVVGMVGVQWGSDEEAVLRRMSVAADARRQGVGLGLLETVEEFCKGRGYKRLKLTTDSQLIASMAMYRRFGFRKVGEDRYGRLLEHHFVKDI